MFDALELQVMEKAAEGHGNIVDVNAAYDQQIQDTVRALYGRGFLKKYGDWDVAITEEGITALNQFHKAEKEKNKREAEEKRKERKQDIRSNIAMCVSVAALIVSILALFRR